MPKTLSILMYHSAGLLSFVSPYFLLSQKQQTLLESLAGAQLVSSRLAGFKLWVLRY